MNMVDDTTLLVIPPVVGDAASCNVSSVPARGLHAHGEAVEFITAGPWPEACIECAVH